MKKTLVIASFHPLISRNILQTDVLSFLLDELLVEEGVDIAILCPDYKELYFREMFSREHVRPIGVRLEPFSRKERLWKELGNALLRTSTIHDNRKERYLRDRNKVGYALFLLIHHTIARLPFVHRLYQRLSPRIHARRSYTKLLHELQPVAIFSTDIFHDEDVRLLATAACLGEKTIGMVRSWDNCTNKGILPVVPQTLLAHNHIIAGELHTFHGIAKNLVAVTGIPQFDYYFHYKPQDPDAFYSKTGFDKSKQVILFAPTGSKFVDDDWYLLQTLVDAVGRGEVPGQPQILVRFPPGDRMEMGRVSIPSLVSVFVDKPGVSFNDAFLKDREMSKDDMVWLADTLYYSDVLISVGSTLCIDIAAFDKPIICPSLPVPAVPSERSMSKMYKKYHYRYLLGSGGCAYVRTREEYIVSIVSALEDPSKDALGRARLLEEQAGPVDGNASRRVADAVIDRLES